MLHIQRPRNFGAILLGLVVVGLSAPLVGYVVWRRAGRPGPAADLKKFAQDAVLTPWPVTVAPGVHLLGAMSPAAVYAIETSEGLVLVDSGSDAEQDKLTRQIVQLGLDPGQVRAVLVTHAHGDHSMGAMPLKRKTGAQIHAGRGDAEPLKRGGPWEAIFSKFEMDGVEIHPTQVDVELSGGESLAFGDTRFHVLATPGHTPGSVCYLLDRGGLRILFSGDTIMSLGHVMGTYAAYFPPIYGGDAWAYLASLRALRALPAPDLLLPGHPRSDPVPKSPRLAPTEWQTLLDQGIHELERLVERYETDGGDFLDGNPKEILPGLHYLGDIDGSAMYVLATPGGLLLFDAPGGDALPEWLGEKLRDLGLGSRELTAVLLTSCVPEATSGLPALVSDTGCRVVGSEACLQIVKTHCPPGTEFLSDGWLQTAGWIDVKAVPLADFRPEALGYVLRVNEKTILDSGRVPLHAGASDRRSLRKAPAGPLEIAGTYRQSREALLLVRPDVWLPAAPFEGRNANLYANEWEKTVRYNLNLPPPVPR